MKKLIIKNYRPIYEFLDMFYNISKAVINAVSGYAFLLLFLYLSMPNWFKNNVLTRTHDLTNIATTLYLIIIAIGMAKAIVNMNTKGIKYSFVQLGYHILTGLIFIFIAATDYTEWIPLAAASVLISLLKPQIKLLNLANFWRTKAYWNNEYDIHNQLDIRSVHTYVEDNQYEVINLTFFDKQNKDTFSTTHIPSDMTEDVKTLVTPEPKIIEKEIEKIIYKNNFEELKTHRVYHRSERNIKDHGKRVSFKELRPKKFQRMARRKQSESNSHQ